MVKTIDSGELILAGVMSGTSADGADAVIARFTNNGYELISAASIDYSHDLQQRIISLNQPGNNDLITSELVAIELAEIYIQVVQKACEKAPIDTKEIHACAVHGQTIRHQPSQGVTVQAVNCAVMAEHLGIDIISDFRSCDVAAGGQGAPLACGFHQWVFAGHKPCAVLNIGGFANITLLIDNKPLYGFDTGPGNALIDLWMAEAFNKPYDFDGQNAASGKVDAKLLTILQQHPFFRQLPPKSTGRDDFHLSWLLDKISKSGCDKKNVAATLTELTAWSIAKALQEIRLNKVIACGGGVNNPVLMKALAKAVAPIETLTSDELQVPAQYMEALAFAWLGWRFLKKESGNVPSVTGAKGERILGCLYPV